MNRNKLRDATLHVMESISSRATRKIRRKLLERKRNPFAIIINPPSRHPRVCGESFHRAKELLSLDGDKPQDLLCFECGSFHPRIKPKARPLKYSHGQNGFELFVMKYYCKKINQAYGQTFAIANTLHKWPTFQETMRAYRHGTNFGAPYMLNINRLNNDDADSDVLALVVDDRLLLRKRLMLGWLVGHQGPLPRYHTARLIQEPMCPHVGETMTFIDVLDKWMAAYDCYRQSTRANSSQQLQGVAYAMHRCTSCPTEMVIEIWPTSLHRGHVNRWMRRNDVIISLTYYTDFGRCESPDEMEWRSLSTWFARPLEKWQGKPAYGRYKSSDAPRNEWPCVDMTHMQPIRTRFEGKLAAPIMIQTMHRPLDQPPAYESSPE